MKDANLFSSSTLVKFLEFSGNFEAIADKEIAFSKYNDERLLQGRKDFSSNSMEDSTERYPRCLAESSRPEERNQNGT